LPGFLPGHCNLLGILRERHIGLARVSISARSLIRNVARSLVRNVARSLVRNVAMQASASCREVRNLDPNPPDSYPHSSSELSFPPSRRPSIALFGRFEQVNSDKNIDDVIMTEIASDSLLPSAFVPVHPSSSSSVPNDERCDKSERKCGNESPIANSLASKKVSAINSDSNRTVSSTSLPEKLSFPNRSTLIATQPCTGIAIGISLPL